MDSVTNLICFENDKALVLRYVKGRLEFVTREGEKEFPITDDFWQWWKRVVSYIDGDPVDICFIYDKEYDILQQADFLEDNIINTGTSFWKLEHIRSYFHQLKPTYSSLILVGPELQECIISEDNCSAIRGFQTNLNFEVPQIVPKRSSSRCRCYRGSEVATADIKGSASECGRDANSGVATTVTESSASECGCDMNSGVATTVTESSASECGRDANSRVAETVTESSASECSCASNSGVDTAVTEASTSSCGCDSNSGVATTVTVGSASKCSCGKEAPITDEDYSEFAKFFIDLNRRERAR